jgi:predicted ester cyclase
MIPELLAEDFVDDHALSGTPPGREGLAALVATCRTAFLDMCETCEELIAFGDQLLGRFTMSGRRSGEFMDVPLWARVTMSGIDIVRVAGGKITEFWCGEHLLELMHQRGAVPDFAANYAAQDER